MFWACSMCEGEERYMHSFGRENGWIDGCRPLGKLGVDMRIILKWIFKE